MDGLHKFDHALLAVTSTPAHRLVAAVSDGASVLLISQAEVATCLRAVGHLLSAARARVLHVRPPLGLTDFMEQAASAFPAPGQNALERGFESLTALDADCDRIVLLVEDAHLLPHPTLRYIEMALRAGPHLQVVLAGLPALADTLAMAGFASLGQRLSVRVDILEPEPDPLPLPPVAIALASRRSWRPAALAASVALVAWSLQSFPVAPAVPTIAAADAVIKPASEPAPPVASAAVPAVPAPVPVAEAAPIPQPAVPVIVAEVPADALPEVAPTPAPVAEASAGPSVPSPEVATSTGVAETPEERHLALPVPPLRVSPSPASTLPPRQVAARSTPVRPERVASLAPAQNQRRCRDIVLRAQLGETPDDGDRTFLRNGCR